MIWQLDFYRSSSPEEKQQILWELSIIDPDNNFIYTAFCPQAEVNTTWLENQIKLVIKQQKTPEKIQVFRPQTLNLMNTVGANLNIKIEPTRNTRELKQWLVQKAENNQTLAIDKPPPQPLPENLWGEQWRFASLTAGDLIEFFAEKPIPICKMPDELLPINLGIASVTLIPGIVIYGGRNSLRLAKWIEENQPYYINYQRAETGGLVLESGLVDRWIIATFDDEEVLKSAISYEQKKELTKGLHFLLVQPDDSGMTYTGLWLLQNEM
jgi:RNA-binding protein Tab2/Atab2